MTTQTHLPRHAADSAPRLPAERCARPAGVATTASCARYGCRPTASNATGPPPRPRRGTAAGAASRTSASRARDLVARRSRRRGRRRTRPTTSG